MHARLLGMDYYTSMKSSSSVPFDAYIDIACFEHLDSPINLRAHYRDEVIGRSASELKKFRQIVEKNPENDEAIEQRLIDFRAWYYEALARKEAEFGGQSPIKELRDYSVLYDDIRNHDRTIFFGGASCTIVAHIIKNQPALAKKLEYYQQGVRAVVPFLP